MRSRNRTRLWSESPTTLHYTSPSINFTTTKRFERDSIYWPPRNQQPISAIGLKNIWDEEIKAISKKIDDEERAEKLNDGRQPTRRLSLIMRTRQERKHDRRLAQFIKSAGSTLATSNNTTMRLFEKQPKGPVSPKRDRRGLRSHEIVSEVDLTPRQDKQLSNPFFPRKRGFSYSNRMDLSRPENFNPGPGAYKIVRYLEQQKKWMKKLIKKSQIE